MPDTSLHIFFSHGRLEAALTRDPSLTGRALSWGQLLKQLALPSPSISGLDDVGALLLLHKILNTPRAQASSLPPKPGPGLVRAIQNLIHECRAGCITPDQLDFVAKETNDVRLAEIADIYRSYLLALKTGVGGVTFSDPDGDLARARASLRQGQLPRVFTQHPVDSVVFHDPLDLSPAEGLVILSLTRALKGRGASVTLSIPDLSPWPTLHQELQRWREVILPESRIDGDLFLHVRAWPTRNDELGQLTHPSSTTTTTGAIQLHRCVSVASEVREVAVKIRTLLQSGIAPETIALTYPPGSEYEAVLAEYFRELAIPWRPRTGAALAKTSLVKLVLSLPHLVLSGWPREELITLFTSGGPLSTRVILGPGWHDGGEVADLLRMSGVQKEGWAGGGYQEHLDALARQLRAQKKDTTADRAQQLAGRLSEFFKKVGEITLPGHPGQLGTRLREVLQTWDILPPTRGEVVAESENILDQLSARSLVEEHSAGRMLRSIFDQVGRASRQVELGELPVEGSLQLLREVLATQQLPIRGARGGTVLLLSMGQLATRSFDYVFMLGMGEGQIPPFQPPDPLLSDEQRSQLDPQVGGLLHTGRYRRLVALRTFWLAILAAQKEVHLSWPAMDDRGNPLLASPFVDELRHSLPQLTVNIHRGGLIPTPTTCATPRELGYLLASRLEHQPPATELSTLPSPGLWAELQHLSTMERARLDFFLGKSPANSYTGFLSSPEIFNFPEVSGAGREELPLSVRQLEMMALCPFRYFAESILHLANPSEQGEDLDPAQSGDLLHRCVEGVYRRLFESKILPLHTTSSDIIHEIVNSTLSDILQTWETSSARVHPHLFQLRAERIRRQVIRLIEQERAEPPPGIPTYFEQSFGGHKDSPLASLRLISPRGDDTLHLRGRIDRIDVEGDQMVVVDYKSGTLSAIESKLKSTELGHFEMQLMVYMWVTRQLLGANTTDAAYISMARVERVQLEARVKRWKGGAGESWLEFALETDPEQRRHLREQPEPPFNLADHLWELTDKIRSGDFRVQPHDCSYCPVRTSCRVLRFSAPEEDV